MNNNLGTNGAVTMGAVTMEAVMETPGTKVKRTVKKAALWLQCMLYTILGSIVAFAAGADGTEAKNSDPVKALDNLKDLVSAIVVAGGGVVFFWGVFNLASAIQSHDSGAMQQAIMKIVAGVIMIAASAIYKFLVNK